MAAIPLSVMFIVPALAFGKMMLDVTMKMIESYGVADGIAEQAISSIRTVFSYVGENQTLKRFSTTLQKNYGTWDKIRFCKGVDVRKYGNYLCKLGFSSLGWNIFDI